MSRTENIFITLSEHFAPSEETIKVDCGMMPCNSPTIAMLNAWTRKAPTFNSDNIELRCKNSYNELINDQEETYSNQQLAHACINFSSLLKSENWSNDFIGNYGTTVRSVFNENKSTSADNYLNDNTEVFSQIDSKLLTKNKDFWNVWIHLYNTEEDTLSRVREVVEALSNDHNVEENIIFVDTSPAILGGKIKMLHPDERNDYDIMDYFLETKIAMPVPMHYILLSSREKGQLHHQKETQKSLWTEHLHRMLKKEGFNLSDVITNERATRAIMLCMKEGFRRAQEVFSPYTFQKG